MNADMKLITAIAMYLSHTQKDPNLCSLLLLIKFLECIGIKSPKVLHLNATSIEGYVHTLTSLLLPPVQVRNALLELRVFVRYLHLQRLKDDDLSFLVKCPQILPMDKYAKTS